MEPRDVAVATITWARDDEEAQVLRDSLRALARSAMPVAVADGGSGAELLETIVRLRGFTLITPDHRGLVPQVQASVRAAERLGTRFLLYAESDKQRFFEHGLAEFLGRAPDDDDVGVALACRSDASFATFPAFQRYTEGTINRLCEEVIGQRGDYSYGPFLVNRRLIPYIEDMPASIGWGWRHFVFGVARRAGLRIVHIPDDYPCPPEQRDEDDADRVHRMRQLSQNIDGLVLSMTADVGSQKRGSPGG